MKNNTPYHILLIEVDLSHTEIMVATRYLMYNHKIFNMEEKSLPTIASNSSDQTRQETPDISSVDTTCGCPDKTHLDTCMQPPKTTVDIEETTKVIVDNTGDTKHIP